MARLIASVLLRDESTGQVVLLAEGDDLPEWAVGQVGDHALAGDGVEDVDGVPVPSWTKAQLSAFADENEIDLGGATTKAEILAAING